MVCVSVCVSIGVETGGLRGRDLSLSSKRAWPPHFCINYCVANYVTDRQIYSQILILALVILCKTYK